MYELHIADVVFMLVLIFSSRYETPLTTYLRNCGEMNRCCAFANGIVFVKNSKTLNHLKRNACKFCIHSTFYCMEQYR